MNTTLVPRLVRKVRLQRDPLDGAHVLLWPERGMRLNETAAAIVLLCDGQRSVDQIVDQVSRQFSVGAESIAPDVIELLEDLQRRALVALH